MSADQYAGQYKFGPRLPVGCLALFQETEDLDVPMLTGASRAELFRGKARARTAKPMKPAELLGHWPVGDEEER